MVGAQQPLASGQSLLEQRDRLSGAARRLVGGSEAVPRGHGVRVVGTQHMLELRNQRPADRNRLQGAVAQYVEVMQHPEPQRQQHPRQLVVGLDHGSRRVVQQRGHLREDGPDSRVVL